MGSSPIFRSLILVYTGIIFLQEKIKIEEKPLRSRGVTCSIFLICCGILEMCKETKEVVLMRESKAEKNKHMNDKKVNEQDFEGRMKILEYANERYRLAAENSSEVIIDYNLADNSLYYVGDRVTKIYGIPQYIENGPEYLVSHGIIQPESTEEFLSIFERLKRGEARTQCTFRAKTKEGEYFWNALILTTVFGETGRPERAVGVLKDITEQREIELLYKSEKLYRNAMEKYAMLYYEVDLTHKTVISGFEEIFNKHHIPFTKEYDKVLPIAIAKMVNPEDRRQVSNLLNAENLLHQFALGNGKHEMEYRRLTDKEDTFWVKGTVYITEDRQAQIVKFFFYVHDINDEKMEELKLKEKAERDELTGLYNKGTAETLIREGIRKCRGKQQKSAFLIIDLDNFKNVNDQMGHAFGDAVLSETAQKLQRICGKQDLAGRIGGDEFALYLRNLKDESEAVEKANKICAMFHDAYSGALNGYKVSGSVGIAVMPEHGNTFEELYQNADIALYSAKNLGKDTFASYDHKMKVLENIQLPKAEFDRDEGKSFSENVMEYIFHILYESRDLERAVKAVIELMTKHFNYSRGYIYEIAEDSEDCSMTYEWYEPGINAMPEELKVIRPDKSGIVRARFQENDLYVMKLGSGLSEEERSIAGEYKIYTRVQYALSGTGKFKGFVGFERYYESRELTKYEIEVVHSVAQTLDVFLAERYAKEKLLESRGLLQAVADCMDTCTYIMDPKDFMLKFVNKNTAEAIPGAKSGAVCYQAIYGREVPCTGCPVLEMLEKGTCGYRKEMYLEPYHQWAKINVAKVDLGDNRSYAIFNGYDFRRYKNQEDEYIVDADAFTRDVVLYEALARSTDDYIYMCDMTRNLYYFPQGMVEEFNLPGRVLEDGANIWSELIHERDRQEFMDSMQDMIDGKTAIHYQEYRAKNKEDKWIWLRCRGYLKRDTKGNPLLFAGILSNQGRRGKIDALSGLPNKYEFENEVRRNIAESENGGTILLLGLDNFKNINNLYGWEVGDRIICESAKKIQEELPDDKQLYRLDGDKFGIYFFREKENEIVSFFSKISALFQKQQECGEYRYFSTISGGYSIFGEEDMTFTAIFKRAEFALECAKADGKNRLSCYDSHTMGGKERRLTLIEHLRESIEADFRGFEVYFQPLVDAKTRKIRSAEALLRWQCSEYGPISPVEFIPLLEQTGLIHSVGRYVLKQAAAVCKEWREVRPDFIINVNLSYVQLQDLTFIPFLEEQIREGKLDPQAIHLELTESCIASEDYALSGVFPKFQKLGFCLEMDDFGTGYSSLEMLKKAPVNVVKIDRVFVKDITESDFDATFISFVVSLCHSVNIKVCLEGIETWEEYQLVNSMGLDYIQGFLFGHPQSKSEFEKAYLQKAE